MSAEFSGFSAFDERLQDASVLHLEVLCDAATSPALMAHAMRRLRDTHELALMGKPRSGCSPWQEIATRLGLGALSGNALEAARLLSDALAARSAAVLIERPEPDSFDARVSARLFGTWPGKLITVGPAAISNAAGAVEVAPVLSDSDKVVWLRALTRDHAQLSGRPTLSELEGWWRRVRAQESVSDEVAISDELRDVLVVLSLAGRPLPVAEARRIPGFSEAEAEALRYGMVTLFDGFVQVAYEWSARVEEWAQAAGPWALREARARILGYRDPWARMQDAILAARLGDLDASATSFAEVLRGTMDPHLRAEFHKRLLGTTVHRDPLKHRAFAVRVARAAVEVGDHAQAEEWINVALLGASPEGAFVLGRAALGRGNLAGAKVAFERARLPEDGSSPDINENAFNSARQLVLADEAAVGLAETLVQLGQTERAVGLAAEVIARKSSPSVVLGARNLLGKQLLSSSKWHEAETHFAEDELEALSHGFDVEAQRGRLNRAIALMSDGRLREAQALLESVRDRSRELGLHQGQTFAMANLAVIAIRRQAYGEALALWQETADRVEASSDRLSSALYLCNTADIYVSLELYDEARRTLERARAAVRGIGHSRLSAHIGTLEASIRLGEGHSELAHRALGRAMRDAEAAADAPTHTRILLLGARLDLEDGNAFSARAKLTRVLSEKSSAFHAAQAKLLLAMCDRAEGVPCIDALRDVLSEVRAMGGDVMVSEVHATMATVCSELGAIDEARAHAARARVILEEIGRGLPAALRATYMAGSRLRALARLSATWEADDARSRASELLAEPSAAGTATRFVGEHPSVQLLLATVRKAARSDLPVLIHGESGTGKELVASALHAWGPRASMPMVSINCGALVESLLLSELFGHEKGAFTGAQARKRGKFEAAHGGTLFLDEIGDISPSTQVALLRVLQEKTFERVGGTASVRVDVRIVCASHKDLAQLVESGLFRHDLYFRLCGVSLKVAPLRERASDIPLLATSILTRIGAARGAPPQLLSNDASQLLAMQRWPGNVRELENVLQTATLFSDAPVLFAADLLEHVQGLRSPNSLSFVPPAVSLKAQADVSASNAQDLRAAELDASRSIYERLRAGEGSLSEAKDQIEVECIRYAMADSAGNITKAAALLGMKRPRLSQLIKELGIRLLLEDA